MDSFTLSAHSLADWQTCKRLYLFNQNYRLAKWRPHRLFNACLRTGIWELSAGSGAEQAVANSQSRFMETATKPGLEVPQGTNTYLASKDWCAMLGSILTAVGRLTLLTIKDPLPKELLGGFTWEPTAWQDDSGQLHRWITVDYWNEDALYREMHGWLTFADICIYESPMMLHVVEIGRVANKRRASSWARVFQRGDMPNTKPHFRSKTGLALQGWQSIYLADTPRANYDSWVDQMIIEGEVERLTHHVTINVPSAAIVKDTRKQILDLGLEIRSAALTPQDYRNIPMSRGACDTWIPCAYQPVCYSEQLVDIEDSGLYVRRYNSTVTQEVLVP
jgi:hypothetical protein